MDDLIKLKDEDILSAIRVARNYASNGSLPFDIAIIKAMQSLAEIKNSEKENVQNGPFEESPFDIPIQSTAAPSVTSLNMVDLGNQLSSPSPLEEKSHEELAKPAAEAGLQLESHYDENMEVALREQQGHDINENPVRQNQGEVYRATPKTVNIDSEDNSEEIKPTEEIIQTDIRSNDNLRTQLDYFKKQAVNNNTLPNDFNSGRIF